MLIFRPMHVHNFSHLILLSMPLFAIIESTLMFNVCSSRGFDMSSAIDKPESKSWSKVQALNIKSQVQKGKRERLILTLSSLCLFYSSIGKQLLNSRACHGQHW